MEDAEPDPPDRHPNMDVDQSDVHPLALVAVNVNLEDIGDQYPVSHVTYQIVTGDEGPPVETISTAAESGESSRVPSPVPQEEGESDPSSASAVVPERLQLTEEGRDDREDKDRETTSSSRPSKRRSLNESADDDDGSLCPICLDSWTSTGDHRICSLKCGHLFGFKCVDRWLKSQVKKTCPTCKKRVGNNNPVRFIYAKRLIAVDNFELESVRRQLDQAICERNQARADLARYMSREHILNQEIASLKSKVDGLMRTTLAHGLHGLDNKPPETVRMYMDKMMEVCKLGQCRVFDTNCNLDLLVASMKSPTNLFNGFGLKKINISSYKPLAFVPAHGLQIRDICFHPENSWILTASMDKYFKVMDNNTNVITHQFVHNIPLWSCAWDTNNQYCLYVGTQSGSLIKYDLRNLSEPVEHLTIDGDMSPVVSIASVPAAPGEPLPQGGVICCKLNSLWIFENIDRMQVKHPLSLEGPFVSMKYHTDTKQLLVSSRPNSRTSYSRHTLSTLYSNDQYKVDCNIVHCFQGGGMQKLLSKSCFLSNHSDYVAAHQEDTKCVHLWSINTGQKVYSVPAHETVLDLKGIQNHQGNYLVSLSETKLKFFKFL